MSPTGGRGTDVPAPVTVREGAEVLAAQQGGTPFLLRRDEAGDLCIHPLPAAPGRITLGRRADLALDGDPTVSRVHAELVAMGDAWVVVDDGLSRNGVFVNGERVPTRRRLSDGDAIRLGATVLVYRASEVEEEGTEIAGSGAAAVTVTATQRAVLAALCRPVVTTPTLPVPASNEQIASELHLSIDAVKGHLRLLFQRFGLQELPPTRKRISLAQHAIRQGLVRLHDA